MSGLMVLVVVGVWAAFGGWVWKSFVRSRIASPQARFAIFVMMALAWFVLPVADEILGARAFEQLCREIPPTTFHGPIAVGPGAFFDESGNRKWKNRDEFSRIQLGSGEWDLLWQLRTEETQIARWPMIVFQARTLRHAKSDGAMVNEFYFRGSGGGWLRRHIGRGQLGGYQCRSAGLAPNDEDSIRFDFGQASEVRGTP